MLDPKNVTLKIKPEAEKIIANKVKPGQVVILALNDGSNGYSKLGGTCTIGANFQLVILDKKDPEFSIPVKNNLDLEMYTSPAELSFLDAGLILNARNSVLALSDNEGIVDGAVTIEEFTGKKLSKEEMEKLGGKIC
ncbi:iron-sulfur cluster biosynthesis family protein [Lactobacillus sp. PV037]|uniref:iron-sulfur cluster biosynthesis family protein n=1 Tax=unclassified Lactobacillus TaxID=2620435 RepID=UPI00223FECFC|nr:MULTISPECIES: iron-sulfur cluster biosynthesis family protein [unclassified Lactobacillus]QNQ81691.1 iron-sulfur cluster biosynthesis family protein [Lactobacillus sp. PV012]QNQ84262.1 iron-sulfur cluster biosynthesis family protein [Lactobacillus sp. PV037]